MITSFKAPNVGGNLLVSSEITNISYGGTRLIKLAYKCLDGSLLCDHTSSVCSMQVIIWVRTVKVAGIGCCLFFFF